MASRKPNKISIRPIGNAQAIASTLGIVGKPVGDDAPADRTAGAPKTAAPTEEPQSRTKPQNAKSAAEKSLPRSPRQPKSSAAAASNSSGQGSEPPPNKLVSTAATVSAAPNRSNEAVAEMPLLIEIKRKLPGKELFVLSLLHEQKNKRNLVQMTVNSIMALYSTVFSDIIKDDTVRRSLKRLSDAGFVKTTSLPGNNSGYVYEIEDLLETDSLTAGEKEEFADLTAFARFKIEFAGR